MCQKDINKSKEKRTLIVVIVTAITMIIEIVAGHMTNSMALLADGWHMGTHAFALGITFIAYVLTRKLSGSDYFTFGTGKFGVLAGYTSSLFLGLTAIWLIYESLLRFINPLNISFNEAILVAFIGFIVNAASIFILKNSEGHSHHEHGAEHNHTHSHHDYNFKAAYLHVLADTLTSIFAIIALLVGRFFGFVFLDPVIGIVGGTIIARWAYQLLKDTCKILLDTENSKIKQKIKEIIESDGDSNIRDLHVWNVSSNEISVIASIETSRGYTVSEYKNRINKIIECAFINIEIHNNKI